MIKTLIFSLLLSFNLTAQHKTMEAIFPEAHFIGETNIYRGIGHVYVPGYNFEIKFSIAINGNFSWNKPIAVVYRLSTGEKALMLLNSECGVLEAHHIYNFNFYYTTRSSCVVDFQIGEYDSERKDIMRYSEIRFIGSSVYLDVSQIRK
ncbi:MAG TPA: hypothetical protein VMT35_02690 [Ignavibacteriaceae bacterium]|nr:hypothetical protein [Ignavibacteriaceae bacterium]